MTKERHLPSAVVSKSIWQAAPLNRLSKLGLECSVIEQLLYAEFEFLTRLTEVLVQRFSHPDPHFWCQPTAFPRPLHGFVSEAFAMKCHQRVIVQIVLRHDRIQRLRAKITFDGILLAVLHVFFHHPGP